MRKPTIWVSDQVRHKPACTVTEDGWRLEILDLESRGIVAKTKALISFAVTAKLICAFVFAYADCWFSHVAAQIINYGTINICMFCGLTYQSTIFQSCWKASWLQGYKTFFNLSSAEHEISTTHKC